MKCFSTVIFQMFQTKHKEKIFAPAQFAASSGLALQQQTYTHLTCNKRKVPVNEIGPTKSRKG
jgi:hypothetical protein